MEASRASVSLREADADGLCLRASTGTDFNPQWRRVFLERSFAKCVHLRGLSPAYGENSMKSIASILAVAIAIAFTAPAFAGPGSTITNKADCEKAGKVWDDAGKKCVEKQ